MRQDEPGEYICMACGHVDYGPGFRPLALAEEPGSRRREPRHGNKGGWSL